METPEEEVPSQVQSSFAKFVAEKGSRLEMEEEEGLQFKEALQRIRLGSRHCFSVQDPQIKLLFQLGVCGRGQHHNYIDIIYY